MGLDLYLVDSAESKAQLIIQLKDKKHTFVHYSSIKGLKPNRDDGNIQEFLASLIKKSIHGLDSLIRASNNVYCCFENSEEGDFHSYILKYRYSQQGSKFKRVYLTSLMQNPELYTERALAVGKKERKAAFKYLFKKILNNHIIALMFKATGLSLNLNSISILKLILLKAKRPPKVTVDYENIQIPLSEELETELLIKLKSKIQSNDGEPIKPINIIDVFGIANERYGLDLLLVNKAIHRLYIKGLITQSSITASKYSLHCTEHDKEHSMVKSKLAIGYDVALQPIQFVDIDALYTPESPENKIYRIISDVYHYNMCKIEFWDFEFEVNGDSLSIPIRFLSVNKPLNLYSPPEFYFFNCIARPDNLGAEVRVVQKKPVSNTGFKLREMLHILYSKNICDINTIVANLDQLSNRGYISIQDGSCACTGLGSLLIERFSKVKSFNLAAIEDYYRSIDDFSIYQEFDMYLGITLEKIELDLQDI